MNNQPRQLNRPKVPKRSKFSLGGEGQRRPRKQVSLFLLAVAGLPSVISGRGPCQACHIRYADDRFNKRATGMAEKPSDQWALPMTSDEHASQHAMSERLFWEEHNIDATALANALYGVWVYFQDPLDAEVMMRQIIYRLKWTA